MYNKYINNIFRNDSGGNLLTEEQKSRLDTDENRKAAIAALNLTGDIFMSVALEDIPACEYVLRILMNMPDLKVIKVKTQYSIRQVGTRSVVLDVLAEDDEGKLYEIEMQNEDKDNHVKRVRYITASVDTAMLDKGAEYGGLPELHVFYISSFDLVGIGKTVYDIERKVKGTDLTLDNGVHEHYINTEIDDNTAVADLMQYFKNTDIADTTHGKLSERIQYLKASKKGVCEMSDIWDKIREDGREEGFEDGLERGQSRTIAVINLYYQGKSVEEIAILQDLPQTVVESIVMQLEV